MSTGWSWYVIVLVASNILGCIWLLHWTAKRRPDDPKPEDTSHIWDGDITEYNKPLPRWWINMFYLTIAFGIGYLAWYPGLGNLPGYAHWTSQKEQAQDQALDDAKLATAIASYKDQPIPQLAQNPVAMALGRSIFSNTCAGCHGSSGRGAKGFPNLTDDIWHWGGKPDQILQTVLDGREGVMPPWGSVLTGMGGDNAVTSVTAYVRSLSHPNDNDYFAAQGKPLFEGICVACHGPAGKGNQAIGAPDLTDSYWLYGDSNEDLRKTIAEGRHGVMPAHRQLLGETRARLVAAYVWSLSHRAATSAGTTKPSQ
jgi:cytochrome c oxidase cbb3-type subunit 3